MGDRAQDGRGLTVAPGASPDAPFIVELGSKAFARFGDYAPVMREFLSSPDVASLVAWSAATRVGFALVEAPAGGRGLADMVAIAVTDGHRRTGVGSALLDRVIATYAKPNPSATLILTVADDNAGAIALFRRHGFAMLPGSVGRYAGGQVSRRMVWTSL